MATAEVMIRGERKTIEGVKEANQFLGDVAPMYAYCTGAEGVPFPLWCPECVEARNWEGCGKHFVAYEERGPGCATLTLESGETIYVDNIINVLAG